MGFDYDFATSTIELIPGTPIKEDTAIKLVVDGVHIGYIKQGGLEQLNKLIGSNNGSSLSIKISRKNCECINSCVQDKIYLAADVSIHLEQ